ncbi:putative transmembrane protein [Senna tora]|uniref:Putative transmembrane protein n=1 Tax=Senna tora TaxID=362788 RepID=A0A834W9Y5_9FABA|nr:putative transmembrane protein [Senna tora]
MSSQVQLQPQQPVQIYPNTVSNQPPSNHSNGSFGTVFIVLAVIVVISAIACFLGRLCNRRYSNSHSNSHSHKQKQKQKPPKHQKQSHHHSRPRDGDIEIGFDKRIPSAKPDGLGPGLGPVRSGRVGPRPPSNGDMKGFEMKLGDESLRFATAS